MKKLVVILQIIVIVISFTACEQKNDIEKLAYVFAVGIDITEDNQYLVTVEVFKHVKEKAMYTIKEANSEEQIPINHSIYSQTGSSINDALDRLSININIELFLGHNKYIVIGKELAEYGIDTVLDSFLRGEEVRTATLLVIADGKAEDIIKEVIMDSSTTAGFVENLILSNNPYSAYSYIYELYNAFKSKTAAIATGFIKIESKQNRLQNAVSYVGAAILKKGKLVTTLNATQTRGYNWIQGNVESGNVFVESENKDKSFTMEILNSRSKIVSKINGDKVNFDIYVKVSGNIVEMQGYESPMENTAILKTMEEEVNKEIEKEIEMAIDEAIYQNHADIFNFGIILYKMHPDRWKDLEEQWDTILSASNIVSFNIKIDTSIKRVGLISESVK